MIAGVAPARRTVRIEQAIEIELPVREVASQWTRFDWRGEVAGPDRVSSAAPIDPSAGRSIAWRCLGLVLVRGVVGFEPRGRSRTGVALRVECAASGFVVRVGGSLGLIAALVARDLRRFKRTVESRQHERARRELQRSELERFRNLTAGRGAVANVEQSWPPPTQPSRDPAAIAVHGWRHGACAPAFVRPAPPERYHDPTGVT
jgi:hypothetical protein